VHLPGPLADRVEEPPVVRDDDQRRSAPGEVVGQPRDRLHVEVVGRLVEDDQVVLAQQERGERAATTLTTGKAGDGPVERHPGQQHLDHLTGAGVRGPLVV
jgi:hypothetical protein